MTPRRFALSLAALVAAALAAAPAAACTPAPGYVVPGNLQLAAQADLIVLGSVVGGTRGGDAGEPAIVVRPLAALKGLLPGQDFPLRGMTLAAGGGGSANMLSDPLELEAAHPASFTGACIRRVFPAGATVLFFLDRREGEWVPAGGPFSRWAEDVPADDAPWVQLTRLYAHAATLGEDDRRALLVDEYEALEARGEDPVAQALMADIGRQLAAPPPSAAPSAPAVPEPSPPPASGDEALSAVQRGIDALAKD